MNKIEVVKVEEVGLKLFVQARYRNVTMNAQLPKKKFDTEQKIANWLIARSIEIDEEKKWNEFQKGGDARV